MILYQSPERATSFSRYPASRPNLELQLLHNYTVMTSKTLAAVNTPATHETWQVTVPSMAFETPCLMDALLAVSALHLRALSPNDPSFVRASHGYMASALSQYSSCLRKGVSAAKAEALFTTSALIAFQASASRRFQNEDRGAQVEDSGYTLPTQWFHSFQGVKAVVLATWKWLRESERVRPIIQAQPALALELNPQQPKFFGPLLEGLNDQLEQTEHCKRIETRRAYEHSVAYLNWAHQKPDRNRILGFPATVSRRFVELIDQHDPRALVIISCFFAMIKVVDDIWWLQGVAKMEVSGISSLVPVEWRSKMDWAVRVSHHEGPMDEDTWGDRLPFDDPMNADEVAGDLHAHIDILAQLTPSVG
jgi:Fungal specific transcription factor domain